ncbi:ribonuclease J, partial [Moraxella catarrhalis]|nr:ribonuclease J [Moraxella catarrhalis]
MTDNNHYENNESNENSSENSKAHHEARAGAFERFTNRKKRFRENMQKNGESLNHEAPSHHKKERHSSKKPNHHHKAKHAPQKTRNYAQEELDNNKVEGVTEILHVNERGTLGFHKELKKGVEANN